MDSPKGEIPAEMVFESSETATAAINQLYAKLRDDSMLTENLYGSNVTMGFYADEFDYYGSSISPINDYMEHRVLATSTINKTFWTTSYQLIYMCNLALDRLKGSKKLPVSTKNQLEGEALFVRALVHFYLTNYYGDIPYVTTSNYAENQLVSKQKHEQVYQLVKDDLMHAQELLPKDYPTSERIRANYFTATALRARVALYQEKWKEAEEQATSIIASNAVYVMENDASKTFLKDSKETILQLKTKKSGDRTYEAIVFVFETGPPVTMALSQRLVNDFEPNDERKQNWIKKVTTNGNSWYCPYKYKQYKVGTTSTEYSILFRLAEQYLIRAEARLNQGNIVGAKEDLNVIRQRAGLTPFTSNTLTDLSAAILKERRLELFSEQGHRWFDLKRLHLAETVLKPIKMGWKSTDVLFPLPEDELLMNPNLLPQNEGY
ncbi:RagB/SusD family nutrient uptake outer membrane protein [Empedobacter falsenii]|uniref:RagB/SusD family nutrient uptake outer membrane protein n=1 Tax=Empedobacter falsenii TaxID=343874 RepID=A0A7H9DYL4_9FLAO|nr:RagB/SusD family nutrient uptake outer membrane protein [Empedobacter falsenii]